jgi:hypothetical protein
MIVFVHPNFHRRQYYNPPATRFMGARWRQPGDLEGTPDLLRASGRARGSEGADGGQASGAQAGSRGITDPLLGSGQLDAASRPAPFLKPGAAESGDDGCSAAARASRSNSDSATPLTQSSCALTSLYGRHRPGRILIDRDQRRPEQTHWDLNFAADDGIADTLGSATHAKWAGLHFRPDSDAF